MRGRSMKLAFLLGAATTALAACGDRDVTMQPGRYEVTGEVTELTMPGAPEQVTEAMKQAAKETQTACLTEEDVKNPGEKLTPRDQPGNACAENTYAWKGGKIDGKLRCSTPEGEMTADMSGTYTGDSFNMNVNTEMPNFVQQGGERARIAMRMEGKRVGECNGTEAKK